MLLYGGEDEEAVKGDVWILSPAAQQAKMQVSLRAQRICAGWLLLIWMD